MHQRSLSSRRSGYTLIELLTVMAIIGILVAMAVASVTKARVQAREAQAVAQIKGLVNAYTTFMVKNGEYPHWGPGQRYGSPGALWTDMVNRGHLPRAWANYAPPPGILVVRGPMDGYDIEILPYTQDAGNLRSTSNYFAIVLRPIGFQERYLGVSIDPATNRLSPTPLYGLTPDIATYSLRPIPDR